MLASPCRSSGQQQHTYTHREILLKATPLLSGNTGWPATKNSLRPWSGIMAMHMLKTFQSFINCILVFTSPNKDNANRHSQTFAIQYVSIYRELKVVFQDLSFTAWKTGGLAVLSSWLIKISRSAWTNTNGYCNFLGLIWKSWTGPARIIYSHNKERLKHEHLCVHVDEWEEWIKRKKE